MPFVLDASLALNWFFRDEQNAYAHRVLRRLDDDPPIVPDIWILEMVNGLLVGERRGRLTPADVALVSAELAELAIDSSEVTLDQALGPVLELARAHGLTAYDAAYLELAMREGLPLATQDAALQAAARRVGVALVE